MPQPAAALARLSSSLHSPPSEFCTSEAFLTHAAVQCPALAQCRAHQQQAANCAQCVHVQLVQLLSCLYALPCGWHLHTQHEISGLETTQQCMDVW